MLRRPIFAILLIVVVLNWHCGRSLAQVKLLPCFDLENHAKVLAFSPDGKILAAAHSSYRRGKAGACELWDVVTGKRLAELEGNGLWSSLAFSLDGRFIAAGGHGMDGVVARIWDVSTGKERCSCKRTANEYVGHISILTFSPDGKTLATSFVIDETGNRWVKLWDAATGAEKPTPRLPAAESIALSPDGKTLVVRRPVKLPADSPTPQGLKNLIEYDNAVKSLGNVALFDSTTGREHVSLRGLTFHQGSFKLLAFSPDSKVLATVSAENPTECSSKIRLWDLATGQPLATLKGHPDAVFAMAFSPDGQSLASASGGGIWLDSSGHEQWARLDGAAGQFHTGYGSSWGRNKEIGAVKIWDTATGRERVSWEVPQPNIYAMTFSPDGKLVTCVSVNGVARVRDAATGAVRATMASGQTGQSPTLSPDRKMLAMARDIPHHAEVAIWDQSFFGKERMTLDSWAGEPVTVSTDGRIISSGIRPTQTIERIDLDNRDSLPLIVREREDIRVEFWDAATGKKRDAFANCRISPDGKSLASTESVIAQDNKSIASSVIKLWDASTGQLRATLKGHAQRVESVQFSPDGATVASASIDGIVTTWDGTSGAMRRTLMNDVKLRGDPRSTSWLAFSSDGKKLALFVGPEAHVKPIALWDVASGTRLALPEDFDAFLKEFGSLTESRQFVVSSNGALRMKKDGDGKLDATARRGSVTTPAISPDGTTLAAGESDGTIRLWDPATSKTRSTLLGHSSGVTCVVFSPDGKSVASGGEDFAVKVWDVATGKDLATFWGHTSQIRSMAFSPDGKTLVSKDSGIKIWDLSAILPTGK